MKYSVEVGRWTGVFAFVWFADVYSDQQPDRIATFNALTRAAARRKAARFIRRWHGEGVHGVTAYAYDSTVGDLRELPIPA